MSQKLLYHNEVLKRFVREGLHITVQPPLLIINHVPYVNSDRTIEYGRIVSLLNLSGDVVVSPSTHVVYFIGNHPCDKDGKEISQIRHSGQNQNIHGLTVNRSFSNKNDHSYENEFEKVINYVRIITAEATAVDQTVTPYIYKQPELFEDEPNYVFTYLDMNASRANIDLINNKLSNQKIGIIGLGGSGSYILEFVSKSPVSEIHLFDGDKFNTHNAFRSPGAASIEELNQNTFKTEYQKNRYSKMHKYISSHPEYINEKNLSSLDALDFIFISMDTGPDKRKIVEYLCSKLIPFIDSGISVTAEGDQLTSTIRITFVHDQFDSTWENRIDFNGGNPEYRTNIQIAELNAQAAILSVIKWKKHYGFYKDDNKSDYIHLIVEAEELIHEN